MSEHINFSEVFTQRQTLAVVFGEDYEANFDILPLLLSVVEQFERVYFYYPEFQYEFFRWLINNSRVICVNLDKPSPLTDNSLVIALASHRNANKFYQSIRQSVIVGNTKSSNFSLLPKSTLPEEICKSTFNWIGIEYRELDKASYSDRFLEEPSSQPLRLNVVLDINNFFNRIKVSKLLTKAKPSVTYLYCRTKSPTKETVIYTASALKQDINLLSLINYIRMSDKIVTDNKDFYYFLSNFPIKNKVYYLGKINTDNLISMNELHNALEVGEQTN